MSSSIIRTAERDVERPNYGPDPADGAIGGEHCVTVGGHVTHRLIH